MRLSLSIEDTNRLRAKVGLRLIRDGPETLVEDELTPSEQAKQIQARILAAEERAEERVLHAAATEGPTKATEFPEQTLSWLETMRQKRGMKENAGAASPQPQSPSSTIPLEISAEHKDQPNEGKSPETLSESGEERRLPQDAGRHVAEDITAMDPLEAPAEPRRELKRQPQLDFDSKKAIFKPKKPKSSSKARARLLTEAPLVAPQQTEDENDAFEHILMRSRIEHSKQKPQQADIQPPPLAAEADVSQSGDTTAGLSIGPTQSFLIEVRQNHESKAGNNTLEHREHAPVTPDTASVQEADAARDGESVDHDSSPVQPNSVAETLKMLRNDRKAPVPSKQVTESRRAWAQRLSAARQAKQADLASSLEAFKHLPSHERQKAYELHRTRLAAQEADAAKELFQNYVPDVDFERKDAHGNVIDGKQAFKLLSSAFHGAKGHHNKSKGSRSA